MRYEIQKVSEAEFKYLLEQNVPMLPGPAHPYNVHVDASKISAPDLKKILKSLKRNRYVAINTGTRRKKAVVHAHQAIAAATALAAAAGGALYCLF